MRPPLPGAVATTLRLVGLELRSHAARSKAAAGGRFVVVGWPLLRSLLLIVLVGEFFMDIATHVEHPGSLDPWIRLRTIVGLVVARDAAARLGAAMDPNRARSAWLAALPIADRVVERSQTIARVLQGPLVTLGVPLCVGLSLHLGAAPLLALAPLTLAVGFELWARLLGRITSLLPRAAQGALLYGSGILDSLLLALTLVAGIEGGSWQGGAVPRMAEAAAGVLRWGPHGGWVWPGLALTVAATLASRWVPLDRARSREAAGSRRAPALMVLRLSEPGTLLLHALLWAVLLASVLRPARWLPLHLWLAAAPVSLLAASRLGQRAASVRNLLLLLPEPPHRAVLRAAGALAGTTALATIAAGLLLGLRADLACSVGVWLGAAQMLCVAIGLLGIEGTSGRAAGSAAAVFLLLVGTTVLGAPSLGLRVTSLLLIGGLAAAAWERLARRMATFGDPARIDLSLDGLDAVAATALMFVAAAAAGWLGHAFGLEPTAEARLLAGQGAGIAAVAAFSRGPGGLRRPRAGSVLRCALGLGLGFVAGAVLLTLASGPLNLDIASPAATLPTVVGGLVLFVGAPFFEEWTMRGLLLPALRRQGGATWAVLGSAAVFAGLHGDGGWPLRLALGVVFGLGYLRGGLALAIGLHAGANLYAAVRGMI